jgi:hypothetical protein
MARIGRRDLLRDGKLVFVPPKMYCFCTADLRIGRFSPLLTKDQDTFKTRINAGFPCIFDNFEYDCFGGRNLRVWFESYLRSYFFLESYGSAAFPRSADLGERR